MEIVRIRDGVDGLGGGWCGDCVLKKARSPDLWQWQPDPVRGYSVWGGYQILTSQLVDSLGIVDDLIWHKQVPLKVSIFSWRLLRDRLPTRENLAIRGIITPEARLIWLDAEAWNLLNTCISPVALLNLFVRLLGRGLEPQAIQKLRIIPISIVGQGEALLLLVVEDNK
ncbi:hypothetical protein TSUD_322550 [Trifolium subterraneum]|uniref:Reverse transcriptase zinc-binding domain-containing protein n=1 Tax=Trifolium subterraneum TaxID=3900 RepID=A0A2Z6N187_TRISU|nr:hypothetical protein TSUD_322550 [Trifolium subterraneum]